MGSYQINDGTGWHQVDKMDAEVVDGHLVLLFQGDEDPVTKKTFKFALAFDADEALELGEGLLRVAVSMDPLAAGFEPAEGEDS